MTRKTLPMDLVGGNPMWSAQMALYAHAAGMTGPITFIDPKGGAGLVVDFDPRLPHVEQLTADLTAAKDEVLAGVRNLLWQQHFLATLPFEPFPPVLLAPNMTDDERYTLTVAR